MLKSDGMQGTLNCDKCKGLLVSDTFIDAFQRRTGIRCVNCGSIKLDGVIPHEYKTKDKRNNKSNELELYRTRRRSTKRNSNAVQH